MKKLIGWKKHLGKLLKGASEDEKKLEELRNEFSRNLKKAIEEEESRHKHMGA